MKKTNHPLVTDKVCGRLLDPATTPRVVFHGGRKYYFCSPGCLSAFEREPGKYTWRKGRMGRFWSHLISIWRSTANADGTYRH